MRFAAALLVAAAAFGQTVPRVGDLGAGRFLVAKRSLADPNFAETVVLLASYDKSGAMGLVINRPTEIPISQLLSGIAGAKQRRDTALEGGPVQPTAVFALIQGKAPPGDAKPVFPTVYLITTKEALEKAFTASTKSAELRVYVGYAGWGPGQLDMEVASGAWHVVAADARTVFDSDPEGVWERMIKRTEWRVARAEGWQAYRPQFAERYTGRPPTNVATGSMFRMSSSATVK